MFASLLHCCAAALLVPTPPHSGYHIRGRRGAFEGWYHRLSLPSDAGVPSVFIYSIFDPEEPESPRHGVGLQLLGVGMESRLLEAPTKGNFWADEHGLGLGHTTMGVPLRQPSSPRAFERFVQGGWQLTPIQHQGRLADGSVSWCYAVEPRMGWGGGAAAKQYSTAGWLAALPVFEPHYQVVMAHGLATGHVTKDGQRHDFKDAPCYTEKNWVRMHTRYAHAHTTCAHYMRMYTRHAHAHTTYTLAELDPHVALHRTRAVYHMCWLCSLTHLGCSQP